NGIPQRAAVHDSRQQGCQREERRGERGHWNPPGFAGTPLGSLLCVVRALPLASGFLRRPAPCLCDFPVGFNLASTARPGPLFSRLSWQQRWPRLAGEVRLHCCLQILPHTAPLLTTRRYHAPDPLAPALPLLTARSLRDVPVDH